MSNLLFNRDTLKWTGTDREKNPYEVEIKNVNIEGLTKPIPVKVKVEKYDVNGNPLYVLPQPPISSVNTTKQMVETTEVTSNPIIITGIKQVPLLDANKNPITYQPTTRGKVTTETSEPVMVDHVDVETHEVTQVQEEDDQGNLLYWGQVSSGPRLTCYTNEEVEVQKKNPKGVLLYYKNVTTETPIEIEQPLLEITSDDPRYIEGLPRALEDGTRNRIAYFASEPELFTYDDVFAYKEKQLTSGTFYEKGILFEKTDNVLFPQEGLIADLGFDFISLDPNGEAQTRLIDLPHAAQFIMVKTETSDTGLTISVGPTADSLEPVSKLNEVVFDQSVSSVIVEFLNLTDKRIDLYSFGILV